MFFKCLPVGFLAANCYILGDEKTKKAVIIDPGGDAQSILNVINKNDFCVELVILTHGHPDHIGALQEILRKTGAKVAFHEKEEALLLNAKKQRQGYFDIESSSEVKIKLKGGEILKIGEINLKIIHTPGHTPGGICIKVNDMIFTGDTLFAGSIGRTDFPGGSYEQIMESINTKLLTQKDQTVIYPGHGGKSTIKQEKATNPFLQ